MEKDFIDLTNENFPNLKEFKEIKKYVQAFLEVKNFEKMKLIYDFLYGKMLSRSKIFILGIMLRKKIKLIDEEKVDFFNLIIETIILIGLECRKTP